MADDGVRVPEPEGPMRAEEDATSPAGGEGSVKLTVQSVILAFVFAFIFRTYLVEPFVIPTGSMAPTLLGAHVRAHGPATGWTWAVSPRDYRDRAEEAPLRVQGDEERPLALTDPMWRRRVFLPGAPLRAGDRILTHKYLFNLLDPERWDVVVFKNPAAPSGNYIKRVVGLPGERIQLVDGDVFASPAEALDLPLSIRRKPLEVQKHLWIPIHATAHAPIELENGTSPPGPWVTESGEALGALPGMFEGETIRWEARATEDDPGDALWPIDDWLFFNDTPVLSSTRARFPVADLRLTAAVALAGEDSRVRLVITGRGHEYSAAIADGSATLAMVDDAGRVAESARADVSWLGARHGSIVRLELWHVDQALHLLIDGEVMASLKYDWDPQERLRHALGEETARRAVPPGADLSERAVDPRNLRRAGVRVEIGGAPVRVHGLALDRDLSYQPIGETGPLRLEAGQHFVLGDNSAASADSRLWERVDPWVARTVGADTHVVERELIMGKAFFVYFPGPHADLRLPVPDFGRTRFIR